MKAYAFLFCLLAFCAGARAQSVELQLPLACELGRTCFVQNWADRDPGPGHADPACGPLTYDGHDGLDFRISAGAMRAGVAVLAPADGRVKALRNSEPDGLFATGGQGAVGGRECGNGVLLDLGGGTEAQLCHLRQGSIRVAVGQTVKAGEAIGLVGMSGKTEFPHVHFALRQNGLKLDPLDGARLNGPTISCTLQAPRAAAFWAPAARAALRYQPSAIVEAGFSSATPGNNPRPEQFSAPPSRSGPLVFHAVAMGPRLGDQLRVELFGPDGALIAQNARTQPRDQAESFVFAGRRAPPGGWPAGTYRARATLQRAAGESETQTAEVVLR